MIKPTDLVQGTLDVLILRDRSRTIARVAILNRIQQMAGKVLQVGQSASYRSPHKLQQNGWITSEWAVRDNNRKARF